MSINPIHCDSCSCSNEQLDRMKGPEEIDLATRGLLSLGEDDDDDQVHSDSCEFCSYSLDVLEKMRQMDEEYPPVASQAGREGDKVDEEQPLVIGSDLSENIYRNCGCWRCEEGIKLFEAEWRKAQSAAEPQLPTLNIGWCGNGDDCSECNESDKHQTRMQICALAGCSMYSLALDMGINPTLLDVDPEYASEYLDNEKDVWYTSDGERVEEPRVIEDTTKKRLQGMNQTIPPADDPFWDDIEDEPCGCCEYDDEDDDSDDDNTPRLFFSKDVIATTIYHDENDSPIKIVEEIEHFEVEL